MRRVVGYIAGIASLIALPSMVWADPAAVPSVRVAGMVTLDTASAEPRSGYQATTALGVGIRGNVSLIGLVSRSPNPRGFFFRDWWLVEGAGGYGGNGLYGRVFVGAGARIGVAGSGSAFFVSPRIFTGANTVRTILSAGTGAGRWAWLLGVGYSSPTFSLEAGYGRGNDTRQDPLSVVDLEVSLGGIAPQPIFVRYQGVFGEVTTEHNLSAGLMLSF